MDNEYVVFNKNEDKAVVSKKENPPQEENQTDDRENNLKLEWFKQNQWYRMIAKLDQYRLTKEKTKKLKTRVRRGIPDCLRGYVWQFFAEVENFRKRGDYFQLLKDKISKNEDLNLAEKDILKDLDRTFPNSTFFKEKLGLGQRSMFNVLSIFSSHYTETGYVQGMGFLTACLLNYMDEETAFCMLISLMEKYKINGFYKQDFPELSKAFYKLTSLIKKFSPKVYEVFKNKRLYPYMYATNWFLTLFFVSVRFEVFLRIFDIFLIEGQKKIIYRIGLALIKLNEDKILNAKEFDELMEIMKKLGEKITVEKLFEEAFSFKITSKNLEEYEKQHDYLTTNNLSDEVLDLINN